MLHALMGDRSCQVIRLWMVFIMRACKSSKALILALVICLFNKESFAEADNQFVQIKQVQLVQSDHKVTFQAELDFALSASARNALHSGIVLYWDVELVLWQKCCAGLWRNILYDRSYRFSLSYYTIVNNYRVRDEQKNTFRRFASLQDALASMSDLNSGMIFLENYDSGRCVRGDFRFAFDKEALPGPLRPFAYFDAQWDLSVQERLPCA